VLESVYGAERGREILTEITRIGHETVRFLEQETGVFGELGVDIIPDERGYPWIIEINGKPGRSVFKRIARSEEVTEAVRRRFQGIREESVARPLRYAATLARRK
jgi:predicted ATP-grasp superfamily ATP-dependent carboligase